ncbi:MAG: DUF2849 domain-containing protein [Azospirillaceae bacterium]
MALMIVTANRLGDGVVVYWRGDGAWTAVIDEAATEEGTLKKDGPAFVARVQEVDPTWRTTVVDPYAMEVVRDGDRLVPARYRERLRALGPTVRPDLGKQVWGPEGHGAPAPADA